MEFADGHESSAYSVIRKEAAIMLKRFQIPIFLVLAAIALFQIGCEPDIDSTADSTLSDPITTEAPGQPLADHGPTDQPPTNQTSANQSTLAVSNATPKLIIGSFNIQTFGKKKFSNSHVVEILVDIVRRFDILAIQELRDGDQKVIYEFLDRVNQDGSQFKVAVGDRQGYRVNGKLSSYFEQAVFIYDSTKIKLVGTPYVSEDRHSRMHRSPYVGHFQCIGISPGRGFSFVLMNVHTDPDDVLAEFEAMLEIIGGIYSNHQEDDFILLGDLNGNPKQFSAFHWMSQQYAAVPATWMTNTRQKKNYDNIVFDAAYTAEFTGQSGVLNLMKEYNLTTAEALKVSDHMPVWAVFSAFESPAAALTQNQPLPTVR